MGIKRVSFYSSTNVTDLNVMTNKSDVRSSECNIEV